MKSYKVKDLMVPLSEYAVVQDDATLLDAVEALEKAQQAFDKERYRHRAVLVFDRNNHIVGKVSQHDVIRALEPNYKKLEESGHGHESLHRFGFSDKYIKSTMDQFSLWEKALENLCEKASQLIVKEIMYAPAEGEFVEENTTLDDAIHRLIIGHHHSLLVTSSRDIREPVGILRLTDVFEFVRNTLREC
jgi:CBS domain-containing protein